MKIAVTGATGTIGRALVAELLQRGDEVTVLSRDSGRARATLGGAVEAIEWARPKEELAPADALRGREAVVNLLGEPLAQRWSERAKREIRDSRVLGTRNLVAGLRALDERPAALLSQSAVGWYGPRGDERLDESARPADEGDFLASVTAGWEVEGRSAEELGMRVVEARTGVVLAASGGALDRMLLPFKLGLGGPVAGGRQFVSWIHIDDVVGAMVFCLDHQEARGPINLTAPEPVANRELSKALGRVLRRPAVAPVPAFALRILYGEMASVVTTGQRAEPRRLLELGYGFRHTDVEEALRAAVKAARGRDRHTTGRA